MSNTYNLASLLEDSAEKYPERQAIVLGDTRLTYAEVNGAANMVANLLASRGIGHGDKVALSCANLPYFTIVYYGILKAGGTVVPLNVLLKAREVAYHLADSDAKAYFCFEGTAELPIGKEGHAGFSDTEGCQDFWMITVDPAGASPVEGTETLGQGMNGQAPTFETVQTDEDDTAVILYTSGTTGQPKGAELRHRNMRDNALAGAELFGADADDPDTYLCVLPLFHSFGQTVIQNGAFAYGGTVVMLPRFEADAALETMAKEKVTLFAGVPTMYWGLLGALEGSQVDVKELAATSGSRRRRLGPPGRGAQGVRQELRGDDPRGLRPVRDLARGQLQPLRRGAPCGLDRHADPGGRDEAAPGRLVGRGRGRRRRRRDRHQGPQRDEGLLQAARGHRRGDQGRLVLLR